MSKKTEQRQVSVMQSYFSGGKVQQMAKASGGDWVDVDKPSWNWDKNDYRTKPKEAKKKTERKDEYRIVTLRIDDYGKVMVSNNLYQELHSNKGEKMVAKIYIEDIKFIDIDDTPEKSGLRIVRKGVENE